MLNAVYANANPGYVFTRFSVLNIRKIGSRNAIGGNMRCDSIQSGTKFPPALNREMAYPASAPMNVTAMVLEMLTMKLLWKEY